MRLILFPRPSVGVGDRQEQVGIGELSWLRASTQRSSPIAGVHSGGGGEGALHRLELWGCEKGSLKPLHRLKVNQARELKEAHHRHRRKAAGNFEPAPPSRVSDRDIGQRDLRLSKCRRGSLERQPGGGGEGRSPP